MSDSYWYTFEDLCSTHRLALTTICRELQLSLE